MWARNIRYAGENRADYSPKMSAAKGRSNSKKARWRNPERGNIGIPWAGPPPGPPSFLGEAKKRDSHPRRKFTTTMDETPRYDARQTNETLSRMSGAKKSSRAKEKERASTEQVGAPPKTRGVEKTVEETNEKGSANRQHGRKDRGKETSFPSPPMGWTAGRANPHTKAWAPLTRNAPEAKQRAGRLQQASEEQEKRNKAPQARRNGSRAAAAAGVGE